MRPVRRRACRRLILTLSAVAVVAVLPVAAPLSPGAAAASSASAHWVTAWSAAPQGPSTLASAGAETFSGYEYTLAVQRLVPPPPTFSNETVRQIMHLHYGGDAVRVQLSNEFGAGPASFPSVSLGQRAGDTGAAVVDGTLRQVTFRGSPSVTIPRGERVLSDPVHLPVEPFDDAVLSIFVPEGNGAATVHGNAQQTFYTAAGDVSTEQAGSAFLSRGIVATPYTATATTAYYYATDIQVATHPEARTLVTLGDSITDGFFSSGDANSRYPDVLARRLLADPGTDHLSVANQAISGSRVVRDGTGPSILDRLEREVFSRPNVGGVIYLHGINDFGTAAGQLPVATAQEVIDGYREVAARMHARGIPIYLSTLLPSGDVLKPVPYGTYSTPDTNAKRSQVNQWIRTEGRTVFDGVIDLDLVVRDPLFPEHLALRFDSGDSLHPNDAGYAAMAEAVSLQMSSLETPGRS